MLNRVLVGFAVLVIAASCAAQDAKPDVKVKLEGHRGGVTALAFAPDSSAVATGSGNGLVRLWDAKTGEVIAKLDPVSGTKVVHVGFSADGKILSAAARKGVLAWSLAEPTKPKELFSDGSSESRRRVGGISGDGRRFYYYDASTSSLRYDSKDGSGATAFGTKLFPLALGAIPDPESGLVAVLCHDAEKKAGVLVFAGLGDTWQLSEGVKATDANPDSVGFSPDAKWLVVCSGGEVMVWRVPGSQKVSGKPRAISPIVGTVYTASAAGPGNLLAIAEKSTTEGQKVRVQLFDLAASEPKPLTTITTDIEDVSALAFAPDGKTLAVADNVEGVVQLWALPAKK